MKKNIIIWANCQGDSIKFMLNKYHSYLFNINSYYNYEFIKNKMDIPCEFKTADIFLYQKYSDQAISDYDIDNILSIHLKKDCIKICFPTLHSCPLLFCYDVNEPNNVKTINSNFHHGKFFYGISTIIDLIEKDGLINIDEIYSKSQQLTFISDEKIKYYYDRNIEFLKNKILSSDIPELFDFIINNFKKVRLWYNQNHPTGILLNELNKSIFRILNLEYKDENEDENIKLLNNMLNDWVMPIFPSVKKYHNIIFEDECSSWYHPSITDSKSYITAYLNELYFSK
jgi:hypothetical protein